MGQGPGKPGTLPRVDFFLPGKLSGNLANDPFHKPTHVPDLIIGHSGALGDLYLAILILDGAGKGMKLTGDDLGLGSIHGFLSAFGGVLGQGIQVNQAGLNAVPDFRTSPGTICLLYTSGIFLFVFKRGRQG